MPLCDRPLTLPKCFVSRSFARSLTNAQPPLSFNPMRMASWGWAFGALVIAACDSSFGVEPEEFVPDASARDATQVDEDVAGDDALAESDSGAGDSSTEDAMVENDAAEASVVDAGADAATCPTITGIVGWWKGESNAKDSAGANDGVWAGTATYVAAKVQKGMYFDGASRVDIADSNTLDVTNAFTIDAWISVGVSNANMRIANKATAFSSDGFLFDVFGGKLRLFSGGGAVESSSNLPIATLVHVAATLSGNSAVLYINGAVAATEATKMFPSPKNALPLRLGQDSSGSTAFVGTIDELALYNRSLTGAEVSTIYSRGANGRCP